jgi:hypothetical protein
LSRKTKRAIAKKLQKAVKDKNVSPIDPEIERVASAVESDPKALWDKIIMAAGAEPREATSLRGASGIQHAALAIGVDDARRRLIVISKEHDARSAALAQADIQAGLRSLQVLVARPVAIDLSAASRNITSILGRSILGAQDLGNKDLIEEALKPSAERLGLTFALAASSALPHLLEAIVQLSKLKFVPQAQGSDEPESIATKDDNPLVIELDELNKWDPTEHDRRFGICAIPLYDFSPEEIDLVLSTDNIDEIRKLLQEHNLLQYFFPAPDQLALGLIERGHATSASQLLEKISEAPALGHPYGEMEVTPPGTQLLNIVDELRERKLVVEGELTLELTPQGQSTRQTIKYKPREGLLSKLLNRFEVKLDLKDIFRS